MGHEVANELAPRRICTRAIAEFQLASNAALVDRPQPLLQSEFGRFIISPTLVAPEKKEKKAMSLLPYNYTGTHITDSSLQHKHVNHIYYI